MTFRLNMSWQHIKIRLTDILLMDIKPAHKSFL
jgi:hypothetical protein